MFLRFCSLDTQSFLKNVLLFRGWRTRCCCAEAFRDRCVPGSELENSTGCLKTILEIFTLHRLNYDKTYDFNFTTRFVSVLTNSCDSFAGRGAL